MGRAVNPLTSVFESSNLSPSTKLKKCFIIEGEKVWIVRVSYNGNTSDFQSDARSSILLIRSKLIKFIKKEEKKRKENGRQKKNLREINPIVTLVQLGT